MGAGMRQLTDLKIKSLKPAKDKKPYDEKDSQVPGLHVRVMGTGQRTFVLLARYPGSSNPTRRALGSYGDLTLDEAREKAREWRKLIKDGRDPSFEEERQRQAKLRQQANTFAAVAEQFIKAKLGKERKGREVERDIRRDLIPKWERRPIAEIARSEIRQLIEDKAQDAPAQARNLLGTVKRLFSWAVDREAYGLSASPAADIKASNIDAIGAKRKRNRALNDEELFALWRTTKRMAYPVGPVYQLLILNALRLNDAADAAKSEFDFRKNVWVIPADRMKGKNEEAREHAVPLTDDTLAVLESLPQFKSGDFLFSTTFGKSPVWIGDKIKKRIDKRMLRTLRALARSRGDDPKRIKLKPWINHDIRRTVRSNLSALRVAEEVREAVLAHVRPGIKGNYDVYDYLDEKREALKLWAKRLRDIVEPPPANVVQLNQSA
jgi:Arm DNA-binding domain/Phage integrase family